MIIKPKLYVVLLFFIFAIHLATIRDVKAYIPCMCNNPSDQCTCFIQLGDKGLVVERIIHELQKKCYLEETKKKDEFTIEVKQAVIQFQADNNLECTGWMDDETLNTLLNNVLPDAGTKNTAKYWDAICYVPTDGGQKHHANPFCSDMLNPRMISRVNAMSLGIGHCRKNTCERFSALTYSSLGLTPRKLPDEYYTVEEDQIMSFSAEIPDLQDDELLERKVPSEDSDIAFIGNKNSHVFHKPTCQTVINMNDKNKITFLTRVEAIEKGYRPCSRCNP